MDASSLTPDGSDSGEGPDVGMLRSQLDQNWVAPHWDAAAPVSQQQKRTSSARTEKEKK